MRVWPTNKVHSVLLLQQIHGISLTLPTLSIYFFQPGNILPYHRPKNSLINNTIPIQKDIPPSFFFFFLNLVSICSSGWCGIHYAHFIDPAVFTVTEIFLPLPPEFWIKYVSPQRALRVTFHNIKFYFLTCLCTCLVVHALIRFPTVKCKPMS